MSSWHGWHWPGALAHRGFRVHPGRTAQAGIQLTRLFGDQVNLVDQVFLVPDKMHHDEPPAGQILQDLIDRQARLRVFEIAGVRPGVQCHPRDRLAPRTLKTIQERAQELTRQGRQGWRHGNYGSHLI